MTLHIETMASPIGTRKAHARGCPLSTFIGGELGGAQELVRHDAEAVNPNVASHQVPQEAYGARPDPCEEAKRGEHSTPLITLGGARVLRRLHGHCRTVKCRSI